MIIISGDSWAVGEYAQDTTLSGPGFGHYLMLHDQVINLAGGGLGIVQSLTRLAVFLDRYRPSYEDRFFWVVTCASNDFTVEQLANTSGIKSLLIDHLQAQLQVADQLAQKHGIKIELIGGPCDLVDFDVSAYANLSVVVPSWGQLLDKNYSTSLFHSVKWHEVGQLIMQSRRDLFDEWAEIADQLTNKHQSQLRLRKEFFSGDINHPDRNAHRLLRDYLYPEWSFKF